MKIAMLGAGAFGKALAKILTDNHHEIGFYDPSVYPDINLEAATYQADAVVITIPSMYLDSFFHDYPQRLKKLPTILASKGLTNVDLFSDFEQFSVISGPGFARHIIDGKPTTFTVSSPFALGLFQNDQAAVELCDDILGIVICGALKNIYAIGAGYYSDDGNINPSFIQRAHAEMKQYLTDHGGEAETVELSCGIGDLILTCMNGTSRNFRCGQMLHEGKKIDEITNELKTVEGLSALVRVDIDGYPLIQEINDFVVASSNQDNNGQ